MYVLCVGVCISSHSLSPFPEQINARDKGNQHPLFGSFFRLHNCWRLILGICCSHRAATTGSTGFVNLLLHPSEGSPKTRLNTGDRMGTSTCPGIVFAELDVEAIRRQHTLAPRHGVGAWRGGRFAHRSWRG
jgi:hypothetical protein